MRNTPFFSAWAALLAPMGSRATQVVGTVKTLTLAQLENCFALCLPCTLLSKALNSRDRIYTLPRTFWAFLWQCLNPQTSCREVVRQIQALFVLQGGTEVSENNGAYCRARKRLDPKTMRGALAYSAQVTERQTPAPKFLQSRPLRVVDGTSVTLSDTPANRKAYPSPKTQYRLITGFPLLRMVMISSLASGAILSMLHGNLHQSESSLLQRLLDTLKKGDILIGDRGFGNFVTLVLLQQLGVDFIGRSLRQVDGRKARQRLGKNDWLLPWKKGSRRSPRLSQEQWAQVPTEQTVRIVRGSLYRKGFRQRQVTLVTTLLDPVAYPAAELLQAYLRRWRLEMGFNDLKTTMGMANLRCRTPEMVEKEALGFLIAHNLIRWLMGRAACQHQVELEALSFKGSVDSLRQFSQARAQARSHKQRQALWEALLRTLAEDLLPDRPGRREPRAVKRKRNKYPRLTGDRHRFQDPPKRHTRRTRSRLRKQASA